MKRFLLILAVISVTSVSYAIPGAGFLNKITGHNQQQNTQQNSQPPQGLFGKIKSGVTHAISSPQCTQAVCGDPYRMTPQLAVYCLGTEGKARTNINCSKVYFQKFCLQNMQGPQTQPCHFAQIAMEKGGSGLGKLTGAVSAIHSKVACTAQMCANPNMGRNELFKCLGTVQNVQRNPNCANAYYQTHCMHQFPTNMPHGFEFCNTIAQFRGHMPFNPNMAAAGCHGSITYTTQGGMPGGLNQSPYGNNTHGNSYGNSSYGGGGITAANPYNNSVGNDDTLY